MASVNKVIIVGNLGKDPEIRTFPNGDQVANVTIATTDRWRDKNTGEDKELTEWHRVVFNGRLAEIVGQFLKKGSQVYVEGSLRTRKWTDQSGQERYSTETRADSMQMLGSRQGGGEDGGGSGEQQQRTGDRQRSNDGQRQQSNDRQQYGSGQQRGNNGGGQQQPQRANSGFDDMDDDIPF